MKKLRIDEMQLERALVRDFDFHDIYPKNIYLDLETGQILHVYDSDLRPDYWACQKMKTKKIEKR
jgi:hypothetical protein